MTESSGFLTLMIVVMFSNSCLPFFYHLLTPKLDGTCPFLFLLSSSGSTDDKPCPVRPSSTTPRQDRVLTRMSLQDKYLTAPQLRLAWKKTCDISVSTSTVKSRLASAGLNGRIARRKPLLTARHRQLRLQFAKKSKTWSKEDWKRVV